ncbi:hypothetical protein AAFC00_002953 [Neodothiora populina]|uniref:Adenylate kinase isoenzyme 6 homolog n=1 Tax=Neodothiora populina TaxID=2781224 RepID=A0ABR3P931_9PEZI
MRTSPNIIITGTPGVGKTTHCQQLAESSGLAHLDVNKVVKERNCDDGYDEELKSVIVDEDKLLDAIESELEAGGQIIDWHACDLFPESLIDLVVVVRCDSTILYDRLKSRGYADNKVEENMDAEIMEVLLQEARDSYAEEVVVELQSNDADQIDSNVERIEAWIKQWRKDHEDS